jgi:hypothetical protein
VVNPDHNCAIAASAEAENAIAEIIASHPDSVVALLFGRRDREERDRWTVGYYDPGQLPETGAFCLVGRARVFFPQGWLVPSLAHKTALVDGGELRIE